MPIADSQSISFGLYTHTQIELMKIVAHYFIHLLLRKMTAFLDGWMDGLNTAPLHTIVSANQNCFAAFTYIKYAHIITYVNQNFVKHIS